MSHTLKSHNQNGAHSTLLAGARSTLLAVALFLLVCAPVNPLVAQNQGGYLAGSQTLVIRNSRITKGVMRVLPQDEVWLITARDSHLAPCDLSLIKVERLSSGQWTPSSLDCLADAHGTDKTKSTLIYAHGNQTDLSWAKSRGLQFYSLALAGTGCQRPPVRYVIFAWKSEREQRCARDFLLKSQRSQQLGITMAQVLTQFPDRKIVLVGFSLGAQVFVSALNQPCLQPPTGSSDNRGGYRIAAIAPVLDGCATCRQVNQFPDGQAVVRAEIFRNSKDRAIRAAKIIRRKQCGDGNITIVDLARRGNLPFGSVDVVELSDTRRKVHRVSVYARSDSVKKGLSQMLNEVYFDSAVPDFVETMESVSENN